MGTRLAKKKVLAAIPDSGGIVTIIATRLGVSWATARAAVDAYPETAQAYADELERMLDLAESKLYDKIQQGDSQDVKWFLSKKGKRRGYADSVDVTSGGKVIRVTLKDDNEPG
jgi:hypothetical protein